MIREESSSYHRVHSARNVHEGEFVDNINIVHVSTKIRKLLEVAINGVLEILNEHFLEEWGQM